MRPSRVRKPITRKDVFIAVSMGVFLLAGLELFYRYWFNAPPPGPFRFVSTVAGANGEFYEPFGIAIKGNAAFVSDGQTDRIWRIENNTATVFAEGIDTPSQLAFDANGNLLVADTGSHTIKSVNAKGEVTIVANGCAGSRHEILETGVAEQSRLNGPVGIAVGPDGKIFFADTYNDRICAIEKGQVTTLAGGGTGYLDGSGPTAQFNTPTGLAIWNDKLLVADTGNHRIRAVEMNGDVWTLAGGDVGQLTDGPLAAASFVQPTALAVADDTIYVADGNAIRRIDMGADPSITTLSNQWRGLIDGDAGTARFNRPSGLAIDANRELLVADSENRLIRRFSSSEKGVAITPEQIAALRDTPDVFREAGPPRWPFDPPMAKRDIAGTLGELRGEIADGNDEPKWFHNGLDIAGAYGETTRFIRDEKVLRPVAVENFDTLRELIRMPTLGYIHVRLGRNADSVPFGDSRFQFLKDTTGKFTGVRVPRGAKFNAGEPLGTLNAMNHVHLIAGRTGSEMNALNALDLPGLTDTRPPVIENVSFFDENWNHIETGPASLRIKQGSKIRIVLRAYDQMDGNSMRRRLGVYRLGHRVLRADGVPVTGPVSRIIFAQMPPNEAVPLVYANGSRSGAKGETIFNYIITNSVAGDEAKEGFLEVAGLEPGRYALTVFAADAFANIESKDIEFEVTR